MLKQGAMGNSPLLHAQLHSLLHLQKWDALYNVLSVLQKIDNIF